jgi:DNA-directed RNA polymerase specialized sigma24 family protein
LPEGKYKVEDFVDELYIEAFESIHEAKEDIYLYLWLFKKADEILDDIIVDEDFDNTFFKNIENYTKVEWEAMEEKISRDADGDLVMLEEFDDRSYLKFDYTLNNVFIEDNELEFIKNLNEQLSQKEIQHQIDVILHLLPMSMRTIFELTINQQFDSEEIAAIKDISISEVEKVLANAKSTILSRLVSKNLPQ